MVACAVVSILVLYARNAYRGDHDNKEGLALKPPPLTSAAMSVSAPVPAPPPPPQPTVVEVEAPPPPTATSIATITSAPRPVEPTVAVAVTNANPNPTPPAPSGSSSDSMTEAAQRALEKEDPRSASDAAGLAWRATQRNPANAEAWLTLGAAYQSLGRKGDAMAAYRQCAKAAATHPRASECRALAGIPNE